jgi:hypothetical protein
MVERSCGAIEGHGTAGPLQAVWAEPEVLDDYRPRLKEHFGDFGHSPPTAVRARLKFPNRGIRP